MSKFSDKSSSETSGSVGLDSISSSDTKEFHGQVGFENEESISATLETDSDTTMKKTTTSIKTMQNTSIVNESEMKEEERKTLSQYDKQSESSKEQDKVVQIVSTLGLPETSQLTFDYSQSFPSLSTSFVSVNTTDIENEYKKIDEARGNVGCNQYYKNINTQYIESMNKLNLYKPDKQQDQHSFAFDGETIDEKKFDLLEQFHQQIIKYNKIVMRTVKQEETLKILQECYFMLLDDALNYDQIEVFLDQMISYVK